MAMITMKFNPIALVRNRKYYSKMLRPTLYGTSSSPGARGVLLTAKFLNLELNIREVDMSKGEHLTQSFLKLNPQHTIPTLDDNGNVICDSHAIATYLVNKYHPNHNLYPADPYKRAKIDQRLFFDAAILFPIHRKCVRKIKYAGAVEQALDDLNTASEACDFANSFLKSNEFMSGNELSLADFFCAATITQMQRIIPIDYGKYVHLGEWLTRMSKIPEFDAINTKNVDNFEIMMQKLINENKKKIVQ